MRLSIVVSFLDLKYIAGTARALSKPLVKLLEVVESGVGALGRPLFVIMNAHAEGRARLIREGYEHRVALLRARNTKELDQLYQDEAPPLLGDGDLDIEVLFESSEEAEIVAARCTQTEQQVKRRANVITVAAEAADQIGADVSNEPVDPDWVARFFSYAQDVSAPQLQSLWGRILAGEVQRPGAVPLRTLDILRNLSLADAKSFIRLGARLTTTGAYLPYGTSALPDTELRQLQDAGLVEDAVGIIRWHVEGPTRKQPFNEPPGSAELRFPSGHVMKIWAQHHFYRVNAWRLRPSAVPLLEVASASTDVNYLHGVVKAINEEEYLKATIDGPQGEPQTP